MANLTCVFDALSGDLLSVRETHTQYTHICIYMHSYLFQIQTLRRVSYFSDKYIFKTTLQSCGFVDNSFHDAAIVSCSLCGRAARKCNSATCLSVRQCFDYGTTFAWSGNNLGLVGRGSRQ